MLAEYPQEDNPYKYTDPDGREPNSVVAIAVIYSALEATIDAVSLTISMINAYQDPTNIDNRIALELDIADALSGPISNPGPSGAMYRMGRTDLLSEKQLSKVDKTLSEFAEVTPKVFDNTGKAHATASASDDLDLFEDVGSNDVGTSDKISYQMISFPTGSSSKSDSHKTSDGGEEK